MGGGQESEVVGQGKRRNKDKEDVTQENMFVRWREDIRVHREDEKRMLERGGKDQRLGSVWYYHQGVTMALFLASDWQRTLVWPLE